MKGLIDAYLESTAEFSEILKDRTAGEIAYDEEVIAGLRKGFPIKKALKLAGEKHPNEALQWDDETIQDIEAHYDYLRNYEDIQMKLKRQRR